MINLGKAVLLALCLLIPTITFSSELISNPEVFLSHVDSLRAEGNDGEALILIENNLPAVRDLSDKTLFLNLVLRQGACLISQYKSASSLPILLDAVQLAEAMQDSVLLCDGIRWLGLAHSYMGEQAEARELFERLLVLAATCDQQEYMGWAQVGMGWQDFQAGLSQESVRRYREAVSHFASVKKMREPNKYRGLIWAWNGVGMGEQSLGQHTLALAAYERAAELARNSGHGIGESMAINNLGTLTFALGDPGSAIKHFARAQTLQLQFGNHKGAVKPALNVVLCQMGLGRYAAAEANLDSLASVCRESNFVTLEAVVLNWQADLAMKQQYVHKAIGMYQNVLGNFSNLPLKNRVDASIGLSRALGEFGRHEEALTTLKASSDEIPTQGAPYQALLIKAETTLHLQALEKHRQALDQLLLVDEIADKRGLAGFRTKALAQAAVSYRALDRPDSALTLLHKAAMVWENQRSLPLDSEWREQRSVVGSRVFTDLAAAILDQAEGGETDQSVGLAFNALQIFKARTLLERLHGPATAIDSFLVDFEPISLTELQQNVLSENELLLDYYLGPEVSFLFAVTQGECRVVRLPNEKELSLKISSYNRFLSNRPKWDGVSNQDDVIEKTRIALRDLVLGGLDDMLENSHLVFFSPDEALNLLPPAVLMPAGIELSWSRTPSATVLARLQEIIMPAEEQFSGRILALVGTGQEGDSPLPGAIRESRRLAKRFWGVDVLLDTGHENSPSPSLTLADFNGYEIVHLATHAQMNDENPWQSYLSLPGFENHGRLTAASIAAASLNPRLAVLAACETGSGRVLSGEGVLGLTNAFISAGVPAVVATLWPVDDNATERLMASFYDELGNGLNAAGALQAAREALRRDPATAHPFFWAGFILVGDGNVQVPLERRRSIKSPILGSFGFLALGLFVLSFRRPA